MEMQEIKVSKNGEELYTGEVWVPAIKDNNNTIEKVWFQVGKVMGNFKDDVENENG